MKLVLFFRKVLSPINSALGNVTDYLDNIVKPIYEKLLETYQGNVDKTWWNNIVLRQAEVEQVGPWIKVSWRMVYLSTAIVLLHAANQKSGFAVISSKVGVLGLTPSIQGNGRS